jgi:hypothetical protein
MSLNKYRLLLKLHYLFIHKLQFLLKYTILSKCHFIIALQVHSPWSLKDL